MTCCRGETVERCAGYQCGSESSCARIVALEASLKPEPDEGEGLGGVRLDADAVAEIDAALEDFQDRFTALAWRVAEWDPADCGEDVRELLGPTRDRLIASATSPAHRRDAPEPRVTHGRHCTCGACEREDWTRPDLGPCGMHGKDCPREYAPIALAGRPVPPLNDPEEPGDMPKAAAAGDSPEGAASGSLSGDETAIREALPDLDEVGAPCCSKCSMRTTR